MGVAGAVAVAVLASLAPLTASASGHEAAAWVVTTAPGAHVDVDGTAIGPRDVRVRATPAEARELAAADGVVAVERDQPAAAAALPVDPCLLGLLCPVDGDQRSLLRIGAELAWSVVAGAPAVTVAIIDGGVDVTHPDLAGRVTAVPPGPAGCAALPTALGTADRTASGHGTRVAGLIAAAGDGRGIAGVVPAGVRVRSYTALGPDLRGSTADVAAAIHCAVDDGVDVVNLSLTAGDTVALRNALDRAAAAGVVVVAAAGNGGNGAHAGPLPAAHPSVLAVTAVVTGNGAERRAAFANGGDWVDLAAPGTGVVSTAPGGRWTVADGTSYAAPLVSGAAALLLARAPDLDAAAVKARLEATAEPLGDSTTGSGLVDAAAAVRTATAASPACAAGPRGWILDAFGGVHAVGGAPAVQTAAYWPGWDIARDLAVAAGQRGGYVLDGYGALHAFGGAPAVRSPAYRPGWDIARAAARRPDGSVVVLDGQGGLHVTAGPPLTGGAWWPGADVARDVAVDPTDPSAAYVLDAHGGVHPAGSAAGRRVTTARYWPEVDAARRLVVLPDGGRGYVVDRRGALHAWALAGGPLPPAVALATTTPAADAVVDGGRLTAVDRTGALVPAGDVPCRPQPRWSRDLARAVAVAP